MKQPTLKSIILDVVPQGTKQGVAEENLQELVSLVQTAGGIVIEKIIQKRGRPSGKTFFGSGKIEEVAEYALENKIDLIIVNDSLKPNQYVNLGKMFPDIKVWDRMDLILNIFDQHASAPEAKLQIKLARMYHEIPKIYARDATTLFERAGAGIGTRGAGEKGIEDEKRHIRSQIKNIKERLQVMQKKQGAQRKNRSQTGMPTVAIVGYTNAGKSSLMKVLTKKDNIRIDDALFVTLETKIGNLWLPTVNKNVLVADTIGFIRDLPPELVSSFLTTLEEARHAELLLHVVDVSDPKYLEKITVVNSILAQLNCSTIPTRVVLNKADRLADFALIQSENACLRLPPKLRALQPILISTTAKFGIETLKETISEHFFSGLHA